MRRNTLIIFSTIFLSLTATETLGQAHDSVLNHIDTAISIMEKHSLYANRIAWEPIRMMAKAETKFSDDKASTFKIIASVFRQLKDYHGTFEQYDDKIKLTDTAKPDLLSAAIKAEWAKGPSIKTAMLGTSAYLRLPGMFAFNQTQIDSYANWLLDSVIALNSRTPKTWIIDLRMNTGGNILPMIAPMAGFFPDGILGYYLDKDNQPISTSLVENRAFLMDDSVHANLRDSVPDLQKPRVAILIGPGTASSGEALAVFFRGRKNTKLFGENSAGFANATEGFPFNHEKSYFLLTTARLGNNKKQPLPDLVKPDVQLVNNDAFGNLMQDTAVQAAMEWFKKK